MRYRPGFHIDEEECKGGAEKGKGPYDPVHTPPASRRAPWNMKQRLFSRQILKRSNETEPTAAQSSDKGGEQNHESPDNDNPCDHTPID